MIPRDALSEYLNTFLEVPLFRDYAPNGLQVEGCGDIKIIRAAVTASQAAIEKAIEDKADALIVHHGYFWKGESPEICGMKRERIKLLLEHDINLFAYHLPLDCHLTLGNNACFAKLLNLTDVESHEAQGTPNLLWTGKLQSPEKPEDFQKALSASFNRMPQLILGGDEHVPIERIAFCTGGAQDYITDAHHHTVDAYLSGEVSERTYYQAKELGLHYYACGHHATERTGIQTLGAHLAQEFSLAYAFIDSDNPV